MTLSDAILRQRADIVILERAIEIQREVLAELVAIAESKEQGATEDGSKAE